MKNDLLSLILIFALNGIKFGATTAVKNENEIKLDANKVVTALPKSYTSTSDYYGVKIGMRLISPTGTLTATTNPSVNLVFTSEIKGTDYYVMTGLVHISSTVTVAVSGSGFSLTKGASSCVIDENRVVTSVVAGTDFTNVKKGMVVVEPTSSLAAGTIPRVSFSTSGLVKSVDTGFNSGIIKDNNVGVVFSKITHL